MAVTSGRGLAAPQRRAARDPAKKDEMLAVLIRNTIAYKAVADRVTVAHVRTISEAHAFVWRTVVAFYNQHQFLPPQGTLITALNQACAENENLLTDDDRTAVDEFMSYAFDDEGVHGCNLAMSKPSRLAAIDTVGQFLQECAAYKLSDIVRDGTVPMDLPAMLEAVRLEWEMADTVSGVDLGLPFQPGWDAAAGLMLAPCGVPTIDAFTGGGWMAPEVNVFMGPYASCKSLLCCHGVAELIRYAVMHARDGSVKHNAAGVALRPVVVLVFTEKNLREYQNRLLSHLAIIPWTKLSRMDGLDMLCNDPHPGVIESTDTIIGTEYERREFKTAIDTGEGFRSEYERAVEAIQVCNDHLVVIDGTNSPDSRYRLGSGGMPEVANAVKSHFQRHPHTYPLSIWVDHISALADRQAEAMGGEVQKTLPTILKRMPREASDLLAKPLGVPIMLFHQLTGQANKKSATAKFHHSEGAWSAEVAQYADFAIVTGPADPDQHCVFECTKHRREPATPKRVVAVQGMFNRIVDKSEEYFIQGTQIVSKAGTGVNATTERFKATMGGREVIEEEDGRDA